jgi:flagellar motor switch protein FliG
MPAAVRKTETPAAPTPSEADGLSGIEKAAILVMYLERETAREVLRRLSDEEVKKLGMAIASVQHIPDGVLEGVVGDFIMALQSVSFVPITGRDFAQEVLPDLVDEGRRHVVAGAIRRRVGGDFEDFIKTKSPSAIAAVLRDEHPQVQAVALLRMGPENASRVLAILPEEAQYDLTIRMARAERVSGALADDVEDSVRRSLEDQDDPLPIGGAQTTARILGRLPREKNQGVLVRLRDEGNDLADRLQRLMVVFEDLVALDDRAIQALLRVVERADLVMALKGASPDLRARFLKNLSSRAAADLQDEMDVLGNPRKAQMRTAQENVTAAAQRLHDDGVIVLVTGPDEEG